MGARKVPLIELLAEKMRGTDPKVLRGLILRGDVIVDGNRLSKESFPVPREARVEVLAQRSFASRGGEKLSPILDLWSIEVGGKAVLDAGCSTGGFTDCLLKRGASRVYAVDVGRGQLDWSLRTDRRVVVMEGTNVMGIREGVLEPPPAFAVADLSFRSLQGAAAHILRLTGEGRGIFLVKPQFEWEDPTPDFHGVIRSTSIMRKILMGLVDSLAGEGVFPAACACSPITGRKGNREFFLLLTREAVLEPEALKVAIDSAIPDEPTGSVPDEPTGSVSQ